MTPNILPTVFTATGNYTPSVINMAEATEGLSLATRNAAKNTEALAIAQRGVGLSFMRSAMGPLALAAGLGYAAKTAMDFGQQMGNVGTLVDTSKENIQQMGTEVLQLGKIIPKPVSDLTEALYQIRSAGVGASNAMNVLKESGKLATAGLGTTTEAANMITSALTVFRKENLSAATASDVLFKSVQGGKTKVSALSEEFGKSALAASDVGVSFRELMAMTAAMTNTGVQTAEAQTAITSALVSMNKRTGLMTTIQQKLSNNSKITGQEFIQWAGGAVGAMKTIDAYAAKTHTDIFKIYGRKEGALADIALTRLQNAAYEQLFTTMSGANTINGKMDEQMKQSAAQFQVFKNGLVQLGVSVGNILLPPLNNLLKVLNPIFEVISEFAQNHKFISQLLLFGGSIMYLNKAFGITIGLLKSYRFFSGLSLTVTGNLTGALLAEGNAARGAAAGVAILNTTWKSSLLLISKVGIALGFVYGIYKLFQKKDDAADAMNAILPHLPEGIDKKKFQEQYSDVLNPGHISLMKRMSGVKSWYPQATYDTLKQKYYTEPVKRQDSIMKAQDSIFHMHTILGNDDSTSTGHQAAYVRPQPPDSSKTDELLVKIYEVLKNNPNAVLQPAMAYAQNGQSAKRTPQNIRLTWTS